MSPIPYETRFNQWLDKAMKEAGSGEPLFRGPMAREIVAVGSLDEIGEEALGQSAAVDVFFNGEYWEADRHIGPFRMTGMPPDTIRELQALLVEEWQPRIDGAVPEEHRKRYITLATLANNSKLVYHPTEEHGFALTPAALGARYVAHMISGAAPK